MVRIAPRDDSLPIRTFHIRLDGNKEAQAWAKALRDTRFGPTREERDALVNVRAILTEQVRITARGRGLMLARRLAGSAWHRYSSLPAVVRSCRADECGYCVKSLTPALGVSKTSASRIVVSCELWELASVRLLAYCTSGSVKRRGCVEHLDASPLVAHERSIRA